VVAILNRRDRSGEPAPPDPGRRSRGALVLDVASAGDGRARAALARARAALEQARYAPCSLLFASPEASWLVALESEGPARVEWIAPGWHVLTHADLDDPAEPRTARLVRELVGFSPRSREEAERRLDDLLRSHGDPSAGIPPVCLHAGRMVTVSSSSVWLAAGEARYRHADGRPCEHRFEDRSSLLRAPAATPDRA
jgi:hypothetical protein